MNEFESTLPEKAPASRWAVVYDPRDGRIVYTHEFIGDAGGASAAAEQAERERIALESVLRHGEGADRLRVLHPPAGFTFEFDKLYRVDAKSGKLVIRADLSPQARKPKRATPRT